MDEPQNYTEQRKPKERQEGRGGGGRRKKKKQNIKKPEAKEHISFHLIYEMPRKCKFIDRKQISGCLGLELRTGLTAYRQEGPFEVDGNIL